MQPKDKVKKVLTECKILVETLKEEFLHENNFTTQIEKVQVNFSIERLLSAINVSEKILNGEI